MTSRTISAGLSILLAIGLLVYLASINFSLPMMTADEIRFLVASRREIADYALISGRYSSLLMIPYAEVLSFGNPDLIHLLPRFASMLLLATGVFLTARRLGFEQLAAMSLTAFIFVAHELDWQHNGLVSFFGIYNTLLAIFLIALLLSETDSRSRWKSGATTILLFGTYASELFVGLAVCHLFLKALVNRQPRLLLRGPFFWSLALYIAATLIIKASTALIDWNAEEMSNYLVGSLGTYGPAEMLTAALLYFINSLPYYHLLGFAASTTLWLSALILIATGACVLLSLRRTSRPGKTPPEMVNAARDWQLLAILALLAVAPNFLMALQPMKVDWILRDASVHYVFSYYTWIGLAIVFASFAKRAVDRFGNLSLRRSALLVMVPMLGYASVQSATQNLNFSREYQGSRTKWIELNSILAQHRSKEVTVPTSYLRHPYISAVEVAQLKSFARKYYDAQLHICRVDRDIDLTQELNGQFVRSQGLSVIEANGRWSEGTTSTIELLEDNPKINFVELEISAIFQENRTGAVTITKGNAEYRFATDGLGKFRFVLPDDQSGSLQIKLQITNPASPAELGLGTDVRKLGLMMKTIRLGHKDALGNESPHVMETCY